MLYDATWVCHIGFVTCWRLLAPKDDWHGPRAQNSFLKCVAAADVDPGGHTYLVESAIFLNSCSAMAFASASEDCLVVLQVPGAGLTGWGDGEGGLTGEGDGVEGAALRGPRYPV